jgi:hypothetical protein
MSHSNNNVIIDFLVNKFTKPLEQHILIFELKTSRKYGSTAHKQLTRAQNFILQILNQHHSIELQNSVVPIAIDFSALGNAYTKRSALALRASYRGFEYHFSQRFGCVVNDGKPFYWERSFSRVVGAALGNDNVMCHAEYRNNADTGEVSGEIDVMAIEPHTGLESLLAHLVGFGITRREKPTPDKQRYIQQPY